MKSIVRIPMATSMKKVEKPVTVISLNFLGSCAGFTSFSVFFFMKKCVIMTMKVMAEPIAVARPAP